MSRYETLGRIEVRDAGDDDVGAIQRVARTTWHHTYRYSIPEGVRAQFLDHAYAADTLRRRIASNVFLVALQDGNIVGFSDFRTLSQTEAELAAIYVLPGMQARGIGGRLLAAGISHFATGTRFVLRVERDNALALRFYEAHGFQRSGELTEELFGYEFHDVEMVLDPGF
ncbi:MAG: GNAT family N-acetyltransferase [Actinomycetota bacterium]|nr:GNAT family N-acetyltransferase [Actinomycetota bacterium]